MHGERTFTCSYTGCGETFTVLFDWTRHVRNHAREARTPAAALEDRPGSKIAPSTQHREPERRRGPSVPAPTPAPVSIALPPAPNPLQLEHYGVPKGTATTPLTMPQPSLIQAPGGRTPVPFVPNYQQFPNSHSTLPHTQTYPSAPHPSIPVSSAIAAALSTPVSVRGSKPPATTPATAPGHTNIILDGNATMGITTTGGSGAKRTYAEVLHEVPYAKAGRVDKRSKRTKTASKDFGLTESNKLTPTPARSNPSTPTPVPVVQNTNAVPSAIATHSSSSCINQPPVSSSLQAPASSAPPSTSTSDKLSTKTSSLAPAPGTAQAPYEISLRIDELVIQARDLAGILSPKFDELVSKAQMIARMNSPAVAEKPVIVAVAAPSASITAVATEPTSQPTSEPTSVSSSTLAEPLTTSANLVESSPLPSSPTPQLPDSPAHDPVATGVKRVNPRVRSRLIVSDSEDSDCSIDVVGVTDSAQVETMEDSFPSLDAGSDWEQPILQCDLRNFSPSILYRVTGKPSTTWKGKQVSRLTQSCQTVFESEEAQIQHHLEHVLAALALVPNFQCPTPECRMIFICENDKEEHEVRTHGKTPSRQQSTSRSSSDISSISSLSTASSRSTSASRSSAPALSAPAVAIPTAVKIDSISRSQPVQQSKQKRTRRLSKGGKAGKDAEPPDFDNKATAARNIATAKLTAAKSSAYQRKQPRSFRGRSGSRSESLKNDDKKQNHIPTQIESQSQSRGSTRSLTEDTEDDFLEPMILGRLFSR